MGYTIHILSLPLCGLSLSHHTNSGSYLIDWFLATYSLNATTKLSISDLADVLSSLKEVTKPYQLGIQLRNDNSVLKKMEENHPGDIDRQKTEVIEYWLRNSTKASWKTLANAVERMGGYTNLVEILREKEQRSDGLSLLQQDSFYVSRRMTPRAVCLKTCGL